jgi:hypothetical protein
MHWTPMVEPSNSSSVHEVLSKDIGVPPATTVSPVSADSRYSRSIRLTVPDANRWGGSVRPSDVGLPVPKHSGWWRRSWIKQMLAFDC